MEIHQLLVAAAWGDAITNEALELRRLFRRHGRSEIFTRHGPDDPSSGIRRLDEYDRLPAAGDPSTVLLVHFSIGDDDVRDFLVDRPERLVLRYHNITPPRPQAGIDPGFPRLLEKGRQQLAELRGRFVAAIAASEFNASDLATLGYTSVSVVPLLIDLQALVSRTPDPGGLGLPGAGEGPMVAFVGRLAPNKGHPQLIQSFHVLRSYLHPDARLFLVGTAPHSYYQYILDRFVLELALPGVTFTGRVSSESLAAVYRRADVFLCLSEHEGFGVPLLEAMAFEVPVVAWASAAVAETVAGAALLLDSQSPLLAAEAVSRVLSDEALRQDLVRRGKRRVRAAAPETVGTRFLEELRRAG